jgi:hypothetical protein
MAREAQTIAAAQQKLATLVVAESQAADVVAKLESDAAARALAWARTPVACGEAEGPSLDGADLASARNLLATASAHAEAARGAEPQLQLEMARAQDRRARLEDEIRGHARDVLTEIADEAATRISALEQEIAVECTKLASLRRPLARLSGQDAMSAKKSVAVVNTLIGERRFAELDVPALEQRYQALADALIGDASATL